MRSVRVSKQVLVAKLLAGGLLASLILAATIVVVLGQEQPPAQSESSLSELQSQPNKGGLFSYFTSARRLLSNGLEAHNQAQSYAGLMPNEDPRTAEMLRQTIDKTTDLINNYREDGLASMPPMPVSLPGLSSLMRLPDKLLRAELSMLQDGIRMAQEMRERPITATMNTPKELSNMFLRMAEQFAQ